jgi:hypothetical protein
VPTNADIDTSNNKKIVLSLVRTEPLASTRKIEQQIQNEQDHSHKDENRHSKYTEKELDIKYLKPDLELKIKKN